MGGSVPATVKLKEEFGDDLAVILVESQGADETTFMKFAAGQKWLGRDLMWTRERPLVTGANGLPNFALLDEEGRLVLLGNPLEQHGMIVDSIEEAIRRAKKGPKGLTPDAQKVRGLLEKGLFAKARAAASDLPEERARVDRRLQRTRDRVEWLLENGYPSAARALFESLLGGCQGDPELESTCAGLTAKIEAASEDLAAEKVLLKLERSLYEKGPDQKLSQRFVKLAEEYPSGKVAGRARQLALWSVRS